jgi:hypothetical protein
MITASRGSSSEHRRTALQQVATIHWVRDAFHRISSSRDLLAPSPLNALITSSVVITAFAII